MGGAGACGGDFPRRHLSQVTAPPMRWSRCRHPTASSEQIRKAKRWHGRLLVPAVLAVALPGDCLAQAAPRQLPIALHAQLAQAAPGTPRPQPVINVGGRIERPDIRVGDSWRYQVTDKLTNLTQAVSIEVTTVTADRIQTQSSRPGAAGATEVWDRDWNQLKQGETEYTPYYPVLQFPLERGKQWSGKAQWRISSGLIHHHVTSQVAAWERVTVPAGTFDAVRIEVRGNFTESQSLAYYPQQGSISNVIWYAPAVGQIIKKELTHRDFTVAANGQVYERWELVEYKLN
jgi:hypothetical protein